jgi:hypothetical protein
VSGVECSGVRVDRGGHGGICIGRICTPICGPWAQASALESHQLPSSISGLWFGSVWEEQGRPCQIPCKCCPSAHSFRCGSSSRPLSLSGTYRYTGSGVRRLLSSTSENPPLHHNFDRFFFQDITGCKLVAVNLDRPISYILFRVSATFFFIVMTTGQELGH